MQTWFSFAVGLIFAAMSEIWEPMEQFIPPFLYVTLPFTGAFNMAAWLPQEWREAVLWSPLVHNVELLRAGMFPPDTLTFSTPLYPLGWCVVLTAIGLPLLHTAKQRAAFT